MNITELRQALITLNFQLQYKEFNTDEAYKKSIKDMTNFIQTKLDNKETPFTKKDLNTCLELFSEVRKNLNRMEGKKEINPAEERMRANFERILNGNRFKNEPEEKPFDDSDSFELSYDAGNPEDDSMLIKESENIAADEDAPEKKASRGPISSAKETLSEIENTIAGVDVNKNWNLDSCIKNSSRNDLVLDKAPDVVGAASSKRNMIKMKYEDGSNVEGFFTADGQLFKLDKGKKFENRLREALIDPKYQNNPTVQNFCKNVLKSEHGASGLLMAMTMEQEETKKKYKKDKPEISQGYDLSLLGEFFGRNKKKIMERLDEINPQLKEFLIDLRNSATDKEIAESSRVYVQYKKSIKADDKTVLAGRNVAMSNVANVLGVPNLVAKSVRATASWKGQHVEGIFTEKVDGMVLPGELDDARYTEAMNVKEKAPSYLKSLADLQVLDYICGNVDRHQDNFSYIIKENKLVGVMGLDNDFSFGTAIPQDDRFISNGVPLNDITVISENMAKRVLSLDDETLRSALNGNGLGEKEIEACIQRKNNIQNRIKISKDELSTKNIKIINDEEWSKLSLDKLASVKDNTKCKNIFEHAQFLDEVVKYIHEEFNVYTQQKKPEPAKKKGKKNEPKAPAEKSFAKSTRREEISAKSVKEKINAIKKFSKEFDRVSHTWSVTHKQYKELKEALDKVSKFKPEKITTEAGRKAFEKCLNDVNAKVDAYILYKEPQNDINEVGQKRLAVAKQLKTHIENEINIFHNASMDYAEKQLEEDMKEYQLENRQVEKIVTVLAQKAIQAHGGKGDVEKAKDLIRGNELFNKLLGSKPETIKKFAELADTNQNKLYKKFSTLLRNYTDNKKANTDKIKEENKKSAANKAPENPEVNKGARIRH